MNKGTYGFPKNRTYQPPPPPPPVGGVSVYVATLTQTSTHAPTATTIFNSIFDEIPGWRYNSAGVYELDYTWSDTTKLWYNITQNYPNFASADFELYTSGNKIYVTSPAGDDILLNTPIEIRYYG